ncbi:MAG TPA: hypothetical protein PKA64_10580 [Myxococcota bacterium]|nr:hypothetical protein [Myxococcota bacterium]
MTVRDDALLDVLARPEAADRLYYAEGVFLDAHDFLQEQGYHRSRLARVADYLHGHGTAAGLRVTYDPPTARDADGFANDRLKVSPGVAVDRTGRLIEVPALCCTRLDRWFVRAPSSTAASDDPDVVFQAALTAAAVDAPDVPVELGPHVVADLYLRFAVCERGLTPAFASGPFDATDAVQPSRLRDGWELALFLRPGSAFVDSSGPTWVPDALLYEDPWERVRADHGLDMAAWHDAVFDAWHHGTADWGADNRLEPGPWMPLEADPTAVFLARVRVPVDLSGGGVPVRRPSSGAVDALPVAAVVDGTGGRPIVWSTAALRAFLRP